MDTERRTLQGAAAHSHVKLATGPLKLAKPLQQPASVTPLHHILHNQTDSAADHTLAPLHSTSHQLPVTLLSTAIRLTLIGLEAETHKSWKNLCKATKCISLPYLH